MFNASGKCILSLYSAEDLAPRGHAAPDSVGRAGSSKGKKGGVKPIPKAAEPRKKTRQVINEDKDDMSDGDSEDMPLFPGPSKHKAHFEADESIEGE